MSYRILGVCPQYGTVVVIECEGHNDHYYGSSVGLFFPYGLIKGVDY